MVSNGLNQPTVARFCHSPGFSWFNECCSEFSSLLIFKPVLLKFIKLVKRFDRFTELTVLEPFFISFMKFSLNTVMICQLKEYADFNATNGGAFGQSIDSSEFSEHTSVFIHELDEFNRCKVNS